MPYAYYRQLPRSERRIYNQSDKIKAVRLPPDLHVSQEIAAIRDALAADKRVQVERACQALSSKLVDRMETCDVRVKVMAKRPSDDWGELQGLYEGREGRKKALITLWMRTAQRNNVVAVRTFLRTLFHEIGHHLDYEYYKLEESYHTEGFYQRESSLFKQLTAGVELPGGGANKADVT